jgi:hypothetical protein
MSLLNLNSTPAERMRRCSFAENFRSNREVIENGGAISGNPVIDDGATLDGTSDYVTYALDGHEFDSAEISIVIEFHPDFDYDENVEKYLYDAPATSRHACLKRDNASNNELVILLGDTIIASIAAATYSPYWNVGTKNVLVVSGTTGDTSVWLNGNNILANDATSWSPKRPAQIFIGTRNDSIGPFDGKITQFKVFHSLLNVQDAAAFYNNTMYTYQDRAIVNLPMLAAQHDPTNTRALDISGNGNHASYTAGATAPTKRSTRGYSFDGGDNFESGTITIPSVDNFTFGCVIQGQSLSVTDYIMTISDSALTNIFGIVSIVNGELRFYSGGGLSANKASYSIDSTSLFTVIGVHDGTDTMIYVNGVKGTDAATPLNPDLGGTQLLYIGIRPGGGNIYTGDIQQVIVLPFYLSSIQVADLHLRMMRGVNDV